MAIKYLYIDDENPGISEGIIKNLRDENLDFDIERPKTWNEQKLHLIDNKVLDKYDGLLLDLKLEFSDGSNNEVKFSGADLAQTIRSDVKAGKIKDLPIFLCSTDVNFMAFFDRTSIDLFDKKYKKNKDLEKEITKREFVSFASAYKAVVASHSIESLVHKAIEKNEELVSLQLELKDFKTPHEFIYLINYYFVQSSGILLNEELLAIRLGIDIQNSPDWYRVKDIVNDFKYNGILGDCYERWWQTDILNWWKGIFGKSLIVMSAQEKVRQLIDKYNFNIFHLPLPEHHRFDTFWYKCRLSNTPLDPSDALRTIEMPRYVWQEPTYISIAYIKSDERDKEQITSLLGANEIRLFENL